ncbi:ABC transporter ATP-binding protein [Halomonas qinghailakensis]|uniref:ABC transporter ATP-binding protein n=1 Tax=Halomonas qinghailakensis TaxID=2937790 RepID=A0AA46YS77_9GAMM|nr:ABC transporter ATP-binding protein [Halomonas sp. ZZQ-149]UYO76358.1 ABC transporter ATP-binding protein [Halomonas sp. ZZQ-149]
MLALHQISKTFSTPQGSLHVLNEINLTLSQGESLALMGESGSGKSTLLHIAAGLEMPNQGEVAIAGQALSSLNEPARARLRRQQLGLIFQQFHLVPSLNVIDNLSLQARLARTENTEWSAYLLDRLGLSGREEHYPEQLSGGQQQRLAIGRALAVRPALLLADEPTGNLDEQSADTVLTLLLDLVKETQCALLMVTHSARVAAPLNRTFRLHLGQLKETRQ